VQKILNLFFELYKLLYRSGSIFYCLHENPRLWRGINEE